MLILGVSILGNLNKEATSQKNLGTSMWQCVISSGIITCIIGIVNIFAVSIFPPLSQPYENYHRTLTETELHVPPKVPRNNRPHDPRPRRPSPTKSNPLHIPPPLKSTLSAPPLLPPQPLKHRRPTQLSHKQIRNKKHQRADRQRRRRRPRLLCREAGFLCIRRCCEWAGGWHSFAACGQWSAEARSGAPSLLSGEEV